MEYLKKLIQPLPLLGQTHKRTCQHPQLYDKISSSLPLYGATSEWAAETISNPRVT